MRNSVIAGIGVAVLAGNAWASPDAVYRTVDQICLFSPTLSPAESPVGVQNLGRARLSGLASVFGYDLQLPARQVANWSLRGGGTKNGTATAVAALKGIDELNGGWGLPERTLNPDIFGRLQNDWTTSRVRSGEGNVDYSKPTFMFSGVPAVGVENNGFVAGLRFKY
jgi:hypothetical protein